MSLVITIASSKFPVLTVIQMKTANEKFKSAINPKLSAFRLLKFQTYSNNFRTKTTVSASLFWLHVKSTKFFNGNKLRNSRLPAGTSNILSFSVINSLRCRCIPSNYALLRFFNIQRLLPALVWEK